MTGPAGLDIVSFYPDYAPQGLEVLVVASSLPSMMPLTLENGQLYFAGVDFKWALDASWPYAWGNGVGSNGWMIVDVPTMEMYDIQPGWDGAVVRNEIETGLGI